MSEQIGQAILILGMHRSGTSYLARLMQAMGVFIGDDLVGPKKGNPRGHFEAVPMLELHQKLIRARLPEDRRAFDDGMLVQEALGADLSPAERDEAKAVIAAMQKDGYWGWKEPRTCLFLSLWKELLPESRSVIVYRHPLEVHQSLLRREHWDLALFPDQAIRSYCVYNKELLELAGGEAFTFNANAGFEGLEGLTGMLEETFGLKRGTALPEFHAKEFNTMPISQTLHTLFGLVYPEAAQVFDSLQEVSAIPYKWEKREDDPELDKIVELLQPMVANLPNEGRAFLGPLLDWWSTGCKNEVFSLYQKLGGEIGGRVQRVEQWNREAAEIFKENERLQADYEKMGKEFTEQQEFLAKQAATQAKIWEELSRTGKSWEEQRDMINDLLAEKRGFLAELEELRKQPDDSGGE